MRPRYSSAKASLGRIRAARIPYELLLLPNERHSPRAEVDLVYLEERILDFFSRRL